MTSWPSRTAMDSMRPGTSKEMTASAFDETGKDNSNPRQLAPHLMDQNSAGVFGAGIGLLGAADSTKLAKESSGASGFSGARVGVGEAGVSRCNAALF